MNPNKLGWIGLGLFALGVAINILTRHVGYSFSNNQWNPSWLYYGYLGGAITAFIGIGLFCYAAFWLVPRKKKGSGT